MNPPIDPARQAELLGLLDALHRGLGDDLGPRREQLNPILDELQRGMSKLAAGDGEAQKGVLMLLDALESLVTTMVLFQGAAA
jgi:hypothetical protein